GQSSICSAGVSASDDQRGWRQLSSGSAIGSPSSSISRIGGSLAWRWGRYSLLSLIESLRMDAPSTNLDRRGTRHQRENRKRRVGRARFLASAPSHGASASSLNRAALDKDLLQRAGYRRVAARVGMDHVGLERVVAENAADHP